jgi:hypothetical protein
MMMTKRLHQYRMIIIHLYQLILMNKIKCLNVVMINQQCEFISFILLRFNSGVVSKNPHTHILKRFNEIYIKIKFSIIRANIC